MLENDNSAINCHSCKLADYCFPVGFNEDELRHFDNIVDQKKIYKAKDYLYKQNAPFSQIIIVRSGCIKNYILDPTGNKQITGFAYPGEVLGLNAISDKKYKEYAVALTTVSVCKIPFKELENISVKVPASQKQLIKLMSEKLSYNSLANLNAPADTRLALFLLNISSRMKRYGSSPVFFYLSMSRQDIGNYLGLATETVSRAFSRLQEQNIITCTRKQISIENLRNLQRVASQH